MDRSGLDAGYSPDVEIGHDNVLRAARDIAKGETITVPLHMIDKAKRTYCDGYQLRDGKTKRAL